MRSPSVTEESVDPFSILWTFGELWALGCSSAIFYSQRIWDLALTSFFLLFPVLTWNNKQYQVAISLCNSSSFPNFQLCAFGVFQSLWVQHVMEGQPCFIKINCLALCLKIKDWVHYFCVCSGTRRQIKWTQNVLLY